MLAMKKDYARKNKNVLVFLPTVLADALGAVRYLR